MVSEPFQHAPLWLRTLAPQLDDPYETQRSQLASAYLQLRAAVIPLASEIAISVPMFTDHSILHLDSLWDTGSLVSGDDFPLNPAEAFILGCAFLFHDLGMGIAAYAGGLLDIKQDPLYIRLLRVAERAQVERVPDDDSHTPKEPQDIALVDFLRRRHSVQAEKLVRDQFQTSGGETFYLLQDTSLRQQFGSLIGTISASHWWNVEELKNLSLKRGSCTDHPPAWEIDPLKVACLLRAADATHIDNRRAGTYTHAFRSISGESQNHWFFQERIARPRLDHDRIEYTSSTSFDRDHSQAWWLAFDTMRGIDDELKRIDALLADLDRPRLRARSVAGVDSPSRLATYIQTTGWVPIDAALKVSDVRELVSSLGGRDLYGNRPWVALRELVANASDATKSLSAIEESPFPGAVIIRLEQDDDGWWLVVHDNGIGMSPTSLVESLTDFGRSSWRDLDIFGESRGLNGDRDFEPVGRYGIGFFSIFMAADKVQIVSLAYEEAPRTTHVLEFENGSLVRPLLRTASADERRRSHGTTVRARLRDDPRSMKGIFRTSSRRVTHTEYLHARVGRICALSDVSIYVQGPDDSQPVKLVDGGDWRTIAAEDLFRRIYPKSTADAFTRLIYDGYESLFATRSQPIVDSNGRVTGRAMLATGWERIGSELVWRQRPDAPIYVGGFESGEIENFMGVFVGKPLTANRLNSFPIAPIGEIVEWVENQADKVTSDDPDELFVGAIYARAFGAEAPVLPCARSAEGLLDGPSLQDWASRRDQILLVEDRLIDFYPSPEEPVFMRYPDGARVVVPDNVLFVHFYSPWLFPEEVYPPPKDSRFADYIEPTPSWDARAWWYESGNYGSAGIVVRTIARAWGIGVPDLVERMVTLELREDADDRVRLVCPDGTPVRLDGISLQRG